MLQVFGNIKPPAALEKFGVISENPGDKPALGNFLNLAIQLLIVGAGLYALFNLLLAGYAFMSAGDDSKKMEGAWAKIWQTAIGLVVTAGAFVLAAIFGWLIYGDPGAILQPSIPTLK